MSSNAERATTADDRINWTETDAGVAIYDEENPEAWVRMEFTAGVEPSKRLFSICDECGLVTPQRTRPGAASVCGECDAEFGGE